MSSSGREQWASRIGLVLAMAGNAIGLGNFLRFPRLAALHGGGAFMIPYIVALLLLGIPLMWVEWTMGRYGGGFHVSTCPGMFDRLWRSRAAKYLGALGISLPLLFVIYYTYIESWTLAYSVFSITQRYFPDDPQKAAREIPDEIPGLDAAALKKMFADHDSNGDQSLARAEWKGTSEQFARLDADRDERISAAEAKPYQQPLANAHTSQFLGDYLGKTDPATRTFFTSLWPALGFWIAAVFLNCWIISHGISGGIERLAKIAMPLLFVFAVALVIRVLTYGAPDPARPNNSVWAGLNYVWQPNFSALTDFNVWLAAAGQIFFTLSIGTGSIQCYSSYLKPSDDCALTGLTTAATNEFAEVVLGGTIAIPIAVATFGLTNTQQIATQGSFDLGFVAMPIIFEKLPGGALFGTLWFSLLFFAGITSSVALAQPLVAFLQDEFKVTRRGAAIVCGAVMLVFGLPIVVWQKTGYMDQYDFWIGTFGLVVFSLIEVLIFAWAFGGDNMWAEMQRGADIKIPRVFFYIIKYVAPLYLLVLLVGWTVQEAAGAILLKSAKSDDVPYLWLSRLTMLAVIAGCTLLVAAAWKRRTVHRSEEPAR
jgi:SNF family Na+-dependent transporter